MSKYLNRRHILVGSTFLWLLPRKSWADTNGAATAQISGPVPVTSETGEPYRGSHERPPTAPGQTPPVLAPFGYIDEEYFLSGSIDGQPYKTALLIRQPSDPAKFSGVVVVEPLHAQGDLPFWGLYRNALMSNGHGWAMVVSQRMALEGYVRKSNPVRYASLQIPDAGEPAPNMLTSGPQDKISQAILAQAGALLKMNGDHAPFARMPLKYTIMSGASQTGMTTFWYMQGTHGRDRLPDGRLVYDGYYPSEAFPFGPASGGDAAVVHVVGEGDFSIFHADAIGRGFGTRGDGDRPSDRWREYQFPGASHLPSRGVPDARMIIGAPLKPDEHLSQFPTSVFYQTAFNHLVGWVTRGVSPPKAPPIEMKNGDIVRDAIGNAKGGVRTPYVDVPTARYLASAPVTEGDSHARAMIGLQQPLAPENLKKLYGSREHYLKRFDKAMDKAVAQRWLTTSDGEKLKADEANIAAF